MPRKIIMVSYHDNTDQTINYRIQIPMEKVEDVNGVDSLIVSLNDREEKFTVSGKLGFLWELVKKIEEDDRTRAQISKTIFFDSHYNVVLKEVSYRELFNICMITEINGEPWFINKVELKDHIQMVYVKPL